jgi:hypothetical protein
LSHPFTEKQLAQAEHFRRAASIAVKPQTTNRPKAVFVFLI